jgi:hypothetical protein
VLSAVERALRAGKGPMALRLIRNQVFLEAKTEEERIRSACYARLVAYVGQTDPAVLSEALALSRQILGTSSLDRWTRLQTISALGGLPSMDFGYSVAPGTELNFRFKVKAALGNEPAGQYEGSLLESARTDPAAVSLVEGALAEDPDFRVRTASAMAIPRLRGSEGEAALVAALSAEQIPSVRVACLSALGEIGYSGLPPLVKTFILQDSSDAETGAALDLLTKTAPKDPETGRFLAECLSSGKLDESPEPLVRSAFQVLGVAPSAALQEGLSQLLVRQASANPAMVEVFVEQAVSLGMAQFKPLFASLLPSVPEDSSAHDALALAIVQLDNPAHYVELAGQIRESETRLQGLWAENNQPGTPPARLTALRNQIQAETDRLSDLKGKLRE